MEQVIYHSENEKYEMQMVVFRKKIRYKYLIKQYLKTCYKSAVLMGIVLISILGCYSIINYKNMNKGLNMANNTDNLNMIYDGQLNDNEDEVEVYSVKINESDAKVSVNNQYVIATHVMNGEYPDGWVENFNKKIIVLQQKLPIGKYWNNMNEYGFDLFRFGDIFSVTDIPCNHNLNGEYYCKTYEGRSDEAYPYYSTSVQCRGFASMLSDLVFGKDAPVYVFEDYDKLRIGDQARIDGDYHTVFIIDKTDEYVVVAECNSDLDTCKINWGRKILREDMSGWYISRWEN